MRVDAQKHDRQHAIDEMCRGIGNDIVRRCAGSS
jgi:hypothetical protein